jgi:hypothetical protein
LAAEHDELVAEHQDLQVLGGVATGQQDEQLDGAAQRQVASFDITQIASETGQRRRHLPRDG